MPSTTSVAVGWSVVFLLAGSYYFVINHRKNKNRRAATVKGTFKSKESRREFKSKKISKNFESSRGKQLAKLIPKARKPAPELKPPESSFLPSNNTEDENQDIANQLTNVTIGTPGSGTSRVSHRSNSVKKSDTHESHNVVEKIPRDGSLENLTAKEVDDLPAQNSVRINVKTSATLSTSQNISDMLEKPSFQTSILRVTDLPSNQSKKSGSENTFKKRERSETKKQRQNRQKAAEAKIIRAQEELDRKVKMQNQRRLARESEGRPAKDGTLFLKSQTIPSSVWRANPCPSDQNTVSTPESLHSEDKVYGNTNQEVVVLLEEEQIRHTIKGTETWNVVKGKEKRNRSIKGSDIESLKPAPKFEVKTNESIKSDSRHPIPILPEQLPNYFIQKENRKFEKYDKVEESEWEVS